MILMIITIFISSKNYKISTLLLALFMFIKFINEFDFFLDTMSPSTFSFWVDLLLWKPSLWE